MFLRDRFTCQYCGSRDDLTFDHVMPRSRGGRTTWENVVTACAPLQPDARATGLPREAQDVPDADAVPADGARPAQQRPAFPPNHLHESWLDYLYWDIELEP